MPLTPTRPSSFTRYLFSFFQAELALRKSFNQSEDAVISLVLCFNWLLTVFSHRLYTTSCFAMMSHPQSSSLCPISHVKFTHSTPQVKIKHWRMLVSKLMLCFSFKT